MKPQLATIYRSLKAKGKNFEVVFISGDRDEASFNRYFSEMPWFALPFASLPNHQQELSQLYGVQGIPCLVLLDKTGKMLSKDGRSVVTQDPSGGWIPKVTVTSLVGTPSLVSSDYLFLAMLDYVLFVYYLHI